MVKACMWAEWKGSLRGIFTEMVEVMDLQEACTVRVYQAIAMEIGITDYKSNLMGRFVTCFVNQKTIENYRRRPRGTGCR